MYPRRGDEKTRTGDNWQLVDELEEFLQQINMWHNFQTLQSNGITSIEQLSKKTSESLKRIGILPGNAVFIARYMDANPPDVGRFDGQFGMMGNNGGGSAINRNEVFTKEDKLLPKYQFPKPYASLKVNRHVGDFAFGSVWEVRQAEANERGVPTGKYKRWALKVQRGDPGAMKEGIRVWKRANARMTLHVPTIISTKEVGSLALVLMKYTPSIPVDSAHKFLSKRWTESQVKQKKLSKPLANCCQ